MTNHTVYNVPRPMQAAAMAAILSGDAWIESARRLYQAHRDLAYELVTAPCARPDGATYLFLDLSSYCRRGEDSALGVLERLVDAGMLLTPGGSFGRSYKKWARLCFSSVPADELREALGRLNEVLERG